jgi:isocitrate dehydrogenase
MSDRTIVVARGNGIGPEIMDAVLKILIASGAPLNFEEVLVGEEVYKQGITSGISDESIDLVRKHGVMLKGPITTPQGKGFKSVNVTLRKALGLFANVRPCKSWEPFVRSHFPKMNLVIVRENEEDLYAGIEHQQTQEVIQCLKLLSIPGTERIVRYAFEYARAYGRKKVTCMTKDNIMKLTDGMFHNVFNSIAAEYPDIATDHMIIDIGTAKIAADPERFDVIVTLNLYGDIISDVAAEVAGSVGLAGSANIGEGVAMFEAIHGSAPDIAGKGIANPSGLLLSAVQMLVHIGQGSYAERIKNAWLTTLEQGIHTADIFREGVSRKRVGTAEFAVAVVSNLGRNPETLQPVHYRDVEIKVSAKPIPARKKELAGVDIFLDWRDGTPDQLGEILEKLSGPFRLKMVTNRGMKVYPDGLPNTICTDHWRCRFVGSGTPAEVVALQQQVLEAGLEVVKTENLYDFDGEPGYSMGQGQ